MPHTSQKVFGVTGWKNNGKTTLTIAIVKELTQRGYKISTIKHAHHDFDIDHENTDSWRHRQAGAAEVAIVSSKRWALIHENKDEEDSSLNQIIAKLEPCDLVIVEGYKHEPHNKIEVRRSKGNDGPHLSESDPHIVAVASDRREIIQNIPIFHIDDITAISDFVEQHMHLKG